MDSSYLICIIGPTAIGKTALSISLANAFSTAIISADSRQFYKEMSIGTAVPSAQELASAPHYFIQHKSVTESYSVGDYQRQALEKITELHKDHNRLILVGGSGLYVDAVTKGLDQFPKVDPEIREGLNKRLKEESLEALQLELKALDPLYYEQVDIHNPHRVIRALEISIGAGKPYSTFLNQGQNKRSFKTIYVGLKADREIMYQRINTRVDLMIKQGLLEEAKSLHHLKDLNALNTVGYKELFAHLDGLTNLNQAVDEIKKNTRRFAKRQLTWYRKKDDILWFDYRSSHEAIAEKIEQAIRQQQPG